MSKPTYEELETAEAELRYVDMKAVIEYQRATLIKISAERDEYIEALDRTQKYHNAKLTALELKYEALKLAAEGLREALEWYAAGCPFRDDLGNETQLAQSALTKYAHVAGEEK